MEPGDFADFNAAAAQQFLKELPSEIRREGEELHVNGFIQELRCIRPGEEYVADIQAETLLQTSLSYDQETRSWWETCSCPVGGGCIHAAGTMIALLAEQSSASVRSLSAGKRRKKGEAVAPSASGVLAREVTRVLSRDLSRAEVEFIRKVEERFARLREKPVVTGEDLIALGIRFTGNTWEKLELWPSLPKDEVEFWRYLAFAAEERGLKWPEFLRSATDLSEIQNQVQQWRRSRDVERWRTLLNNLQLGPSEDARSADEMELRLRFTESEALVEFRKPGALDWSSIKPGKFRDFDEKHGDQLAPEVALLWQPLAQRARYGYQIHLVYHDQQTRRLLNRFLRLPALDSFLVGAGGDPLIRPSQPLRWHLDPAVEEGDDYRLRLVCPDGAPSPKTLVVLQGRPTLYLTADTVWQGPPVEDRALDPAVETPIPAPSLEAVNGVRLLQYLGIPLPPRIAERVWTISLQPMIQGELRTIAFGNDTEYAVLDVLAVSPDAAYAERWNGSSWLDAKLSAETPDNVEGNKERLVTYDRAALVDIPRMLEPAGFKWDFARQRWLMRVTAKFPDQFMAWLSSVPSQVRLELRGELASFGQATVAGRVRLDVVEAGMDWFDLKVILDVTDTQLTAEEIKALLDARGKWVRLANRGWRKLEFKLSPEEDSQLARLGINPHELTGESQRFHALQLADAAAKTFVGEEKYESIRRRAAEIQARVTPEIPGSLRAELRPYQREGFHFLCYLASNRFGGILADDMGLGKTLQTLAWIAWLREQSPAVFPSAPLPGIQSGPEVVKGRRRKEVQESSMAGPGLSEISLQAPILVICPKSVTDNWRAETEKFTPHLKVSVWRSEKVKDLTALAGTADLHIINYNQLRILGESLGRLEFCAVVLDEGQYIKNPTSITAQLARGLKARYRLVLSGTPIENKLLDLWSLMNFAMPGALGGRSEFAKLFDSKTDSLARQRLGARVRPFLLRRTKSQVAKDLPDRIEEDLFCELEGEQKTLYRAELKRAQAMLLRVNTPAALAKHRFNFLTSLLRLRQICCHPRLTKSDSTGESAKVEALLETLEPLMEEGQKVLVFSQFVEMLDLLKDAIAARGWPTYYLVGGTEKRGDLVRQFQTHEGEAVFLISLKAGGFGLNLTAASYVVLFDPWWNPAVEAQAIDRTHRIGQTQKVIAYRLLIKDSVEEKIRALQRQKFQLANDILGEEKFAQSLTLEDLRFLLAD